RPGWRSGRRQPACARGHLRAGAARLATWPTPPAPCSSPSSAVAPFLVSPPGRAWSTASLASKLVYKSSKAWASICWAGTLLVLDGVQGPTERPIHPADYPGSDHARQYDHAIPHEPRMVAAP